MVPADGEKGGLAALAKLKQQHPHIRTLISIGGGSGSAEFPALAASPDARANFARHVKDFVDKWNFDGVDSNLPLFPFTPFPDPPVPPAKRRYQDTRANAPTVDWEHPSTPQQGQDYLSLLTSLRSVLPAPRYDLASALPTGEYVLKHIDLRALSSLLTHLNLMAYDFTGPWTKTAGHHAQLYPNPSTAGCKSAAAGVEYLVRSGFPAQKIILGIPAYAQCFKGVNAPGMPFDGKSKGACCAVEYHDLDANCVRNATVCKQTASASFVDEAGEESKGFMSFDVPETVRMKARYVKENGLGGLFFWTGAGDRPAGCGESLVEAAFGELRR